MKTHLPPADSKPSLVPPMPAKRSIKVKLYFLVSDAGKFIPFELNKEIPLPAMTVDVEMSDTVQLPVAEIMNETALTESLESARKIFNVFEQMLFIPLPE